MPEEMRALRNEFFTPRHISKEAMLLQKIWGFFKKIKVFLFLRIDNCRPFEGGSGQMFPMPSILIRLCWNPQFTF